MWKDDAIDEHVLPIAQLLVDNAPDDIKSVEFVGTCLEGVEGVTASIQKLDGTVAYHRTFFDFAGELKKELRLFHQKFKEHGEGWKAIRLEVQSDGTFDLQFEFDDPYRWDD